MGRSGILLNRSCKGAAAPDCETELTGKGQARFGSWSDCPLTEINVRGGKTHITQCATDRAPGGETS
jgi:hypothetical protein